MDMIKFDHDTTVQVVRFGKVAVVAIFASTAQPHAPSPLRDNKLPKFDSTQVADLSPWFNALAVPTIGPDQIAIRRIRDLNVYSDGWNGPDSVGPHPAAIEDAEVFVRNLFSSGDVVPPHITLASDGEVNFFWRGPTGTVDLGFFGSGTYSYYAAPKDGTPGGSDSVMPNSIPRDVLAIVGKEA
jgi:hypothetical protein